MPSVLITMADYGHEPTETSVPWSIFKEAGFDITFATENGKTPKCDSKLLYGATGVLIGATAAVKRTYKLLEQDQAFLNPISWLAPEFNVKAYDAVFVPGGHEKHIRQLLDSRWLHGQLQNFFPLTERNGVDNKTLVAICHGVQLLAFTPALDTPKQAFPLDESSSIKKDTPFKSLIHSCATTALPGFMESVAFRASRPLLKDYYKSYGPQTPNVEDYVRHGLDDDEAQFKVGPAWFNPMWVRPFIVEDQCHRYLSGRFMPDAEALGRRAVEVINEACKPKEVCLSV